MPLFKQLDEDSLKKALERDSTNGRNGHVNTEENEEEDEFDEEDEEDIDIPPMPSGGSTINGLTADILSDSSADTAVRELLSDKNLLMKTDLSPEAVPVVARILTLAYKYRAERLWQFIWMYLKLRVSVNRFGRREVVQLALRRQGMMEDEDL